jgi:hypothetical protein
LLYLWSPKVERKLPKVYLPFVLNKPLYSRSKKHYYPPGTPKWYEHVKEAFRLNQIRKSDEQKQIKSNNDTVYYGTTSSKLKKRKKTVNCLTDFQNKFHKAYNFTSKYREKDKISALRSQLTYNPGRKDPDSEVTSDNTKEIEHRLLKRNDTTEPRIHLAVSMISRKKSCVLLTGADDCLDKEI